MFRRSGCRFAGKNMRRASDTEACCMTATIPPDEGMRRSRICLLHPFDPRGSKVGGLETYIRDFIGFHPPDVDVLLIGVDGRGDLTLGETHWATFRGRTFEFLPILHYPDDRAREAARSVRESITAQFFLSLLRRDRLADRKSTRL